MSQFKQLSPVLIVDQIESCLPFWVGLGFTLENQVPGSDGHLVFASAKRDSVEIMYQSRASVLIQRPESASDLAGHSVVLYVAVASLDDVEPALAAAPLVRPRHRTFYGATEIYVREPGGNIVGFAQMG